jgi:hypothetical protein
MIEITTSNSISVNAACEREVSRFRVSIEGLLRARLP